MSGQTWTPAPKRGRIPLHPMTLGLVLGRSFESLRHNPKVLLGFAVVVQFLVLILTTAVLGLVGWFVWMRVSSVPPGSPDMAPIVAGSFALGFLASVLMGIVSTAFTSIVQGLVAADVSFAALGRKAPLRTLWARVKPAFWRLFTFALLQSLAAMLWAVLLVGVIFGIITGVGVDTTAWVPAVIGVVLLVVLGTIPLYVWLITKLMVVPAVLVLEHATLREALLRSWRLIRGRFWFAFAVMLLIGLIMGVVTQVVALPATLLSGLLGGVLVPTGTEGPSAVIGLLVANILPQVLILAVSSITLIVQGTGATLVYLDSRMRYEGLDQALIRHVEASALGTADEALGDPYAVDPARAVSKNPPPVQSPVPVTGYGYPAAPGYPATGYPAPAGYAQPGYAPAPTGATPGYSAQPGYPAPQGYPGQGYPGQQGYPLQQGYPAPQTYAPAPAGAQANPGAPVPTGEAPSAAPIPPATNSPWAAPGADT